MTFVFNGFAMTSAHHFLSKHILCLLMVSSFRACQSSTASLFAFRFGSQLSSNVSPVFLSSAQRMRYWYRDWAIIASTSYSLSGSSLGCFDGPANSR